jgi:hypothetical protein
MTCTNAECKVAELLMMGSGTARNMQSAKPENKNKNLENSASGWFLLKKKSVFVSAVKLLGENGL